MHILSCGFEKSNKYRNQLCMSYLFRCFISHILCNPQPAGLIGSNRQGEFVIIFPGPDQLRHGSGRGLGYLLMVRGWGQGEELGFGFELGFGVTTIRQPQYNHNTITIQSQDDHKTTTRQPQDNLKTTTRQPQDNHKTRQDKTTTRQPQDKTRQVDFLVFFGRQLAFGWSTVCFCQFLAAFATFGYRNYFDPTKNC